MNSTYFKNGSFVDFMGETHQFIVAVRVSSDDAPAIHTGDSLIMGDTRVGIGVAICNTADEWDEKKGQMIAEGRARKYDNSIAVIGSPALRALITDDSVQNVLDTEVEYVKEHPGLFIKGYDEQNRRFKTRKLFQEQLDKTEPDEKSFIEKVLSNKLSEAAKKLLHIL